jgi:hypothetical protein
VPLWEAISEVLNGNNAIIVLAFLLFFLLIGWWLVSHGYLTIHSDVVSMGKEAEAREREVIQHQCEYVKAHLNALEANIEKPDGYDPFRGKYIVERMYDEYVVMITQNHIKTSSAYVHIKQEIILALVDSLTIFPEYKTAEFKEMLRQDTKKCIETLVEIRKAYYK